MSLKRPRLGLKAYVYPPETNGMTDATSAADSPTSPELPTRTERPTGRRRQAGLAAATVGLAMLIIGACATSSSADELTGLINNDRASHRLQQLGQNWALISKAQKQAQAMAAAGYIFHTNLAADNPYQWRALGENVQVNFTGVSMTAVNNQFLSSSPHKQNMENPGFNYVGVAIYDDGKGRIWIVEEFMQL